MSEVDKQRAKQTREHQILSFIEKYRIQQPGAYYELLGLIIDRERRAVEFIQTVAGSYIRELE